MIEPTYEELMDEREILILQTQHLPAGTKRQEKAWERINEINRIIAKMK